MASDNAFYAIEYIHYFNGVQCFLIPNAMLVSTKTHPPRLKPNLLFRENLTEHLESAAQKPLALIAGPAGYGKTSLALQWIDRYDPHVAWYAMDETDNDPDLFLRYLMVSLIHAEKRLAEMLNPLVQDRHPQTPDDAIPMILHSLNTLDRKLYIVLDDYHVISNDVVHRSVVRLLTYLPENAHVIIISRHPLPQKFSRAKYNCETEAITADDLKLSEKEARGFFDVTIPLEIAEHQIQKLLGITGGWVTGFQIFGLSRKQNKTDMPAQHMLKITGREAIDYLMSEVVESQPDPVKAFLYRTAGLDRLNPALCQYVTGYPDAEKTLHHLYHQNLFISPLDDAFSWFRFHHLFSEALREWVKRAHPGLLEQTRKKAAMWCAEHLYPEEAFQYALASGDFEFLADTLEDYLFGILHHLEIVSSLRWLSMLPRHVIVNRLLLRLIECYLKLLNMQLPEAEAILAEVKMQLANGMKRYDPARELFVRDYLTHLQITVACHRNDYDIDIAPVKKIVKEISRRNRRVSNHMSIMTVARCYGRSGDYRSAEKEIKKVWADVFTADNISDQIICMTMLADIERSRGRMTRAEKMLMKGFDLLKQQQLTDTPVANLLYRSMAFIFFLRNDIDQALDHITRCLTYVERLGVVDSIFSDYYLLASLWIAKGDLKKAAHYAQKSKTLADSLDYHIITDMSEILFAIIAIHQGNRDALKSRASHFKPDPAGCFTIQHIFKTMIFATSLMHQKNPSAAAGVLEKLRKPCIEREFLENLLEVDVFLSGIYFLMGKKDKAEEFMANAVSFAGKEGYVRVFAVYAGLIHPILEALRHNPDPIYQSDYFKALVHTCRPQKNHAPKTARRALKSNPYNLTPRELEILAFISNGYRNKQIADKAFISLSTVKTHIQHILNKLGVTSRTQAALKAKEILHP